MGGNWTNEGGMRVPDSGKDAFDGKAGGAGSTDTLPDWKHLWAEGQVLLRGRAGGWMGAWQSGQEGRSALSQVWQDEFIHEAWSEMIGRHNRAGSVQGSSS